MELEFQKKEIPCLRTVLHQVQTQEQTQEVRLEDEMPDIGRVLSCWGQVVLRGKEWRSGAISVNGGVMVWVLYAPEDGSAPQCLQTWLPMQIKYDLPGNEPDGEIIAIPQLYSVDARSTAARRMILRACVGVAVEAVCPDQETVYSAPELPADVYTLENTYPLCIPAEAGEKAFALEETVKIPASCPEPAKILRYELQPEITEQRLLSDKLIFRGSGVVHILYADAEGILHAFEEELPVSQYAELHREHPEDSDATVCLALTNLEVDMTGDHGLQVKAGMVGQYIVLDRALVCVTEDAYSPSRQTECKTEQLSVTTVLERTADTLSAEVIPEEGYSRIVDAAFYPEHPRIYRDDGMVTAELCGAFHLLYCDTEGILRGKVCKWEGRKEISASGDVKVNMRLRPTGVAEVTDCSRKLHMDILSIGNAGIPMVTGLEAGEICERDPQRPSLILRRSGEDRLWDVAKQNGSSVEMIMKLNGLQDEPEEGQMLLIPVL